MMRRALGAVVLLAACGGPSGSGDDGGPPDAGPSRDAGSTLDAGAGDAGAVDAGWDAGVADAGEVDAGPPARLGISGRWVLAPDGGPITLRGYNWGQWGTAQPDDAQANVAQGANVVRLPLRWWGDWKPGVDSRSDGGDPGHIDPAHLTLLDQTITWATEHQLWVVLFVDSNYGQGANGSTDNFWTDPVMKQQFIEVWQFLVRRYRDRPYIGAWEILPEPQVNVPDAQIRAFYESIIPFIRELDPRTPIVVGGGNGYSLKLLKAAHSAVDPKLIYTGDYFIYYGEPDGGERMPYITDFLATFDAPVWVNQLGAHGDDPNGLAKARVTLAELADAGVGWAWWTYRELATTPKEYGIYYSDATDGGWILKQDWYSLVGGAL